MSPSAGASITRWMALRLVDAFLAAQRSGQLAAGLQQRARLARRVARRLLPPLQRVAGDARMLDPGQPQPWLLLQRALVAGLRPDGQPGLDPIPPEAWRQPGADWRALLALACQQGLLAVPPMPGGYRSRPDEPIADRLCGLWDVAPSTVYRSADKARRRLADALAQRLDGAALQKHQLALQHQVYRLLDLADADAQQAWHHQQASRALAAQQGASALWHASQAADPASARIAITALQRFAVPLAALPDTDLLLQQLAGVTLDHASQVQLSLAEAALWRVRGDVAAECSACERALRLADAAADDLLLARAYGALGRHLETRDPARAFACFQDSADHLHRAQLPDGQTADDAALLDECANTLVRLAWWYLLHNDPRAAALLQRAQALHDHSPRGSEARALLAQTWGEYWRRSGDLPRALEHKYRALHLYQRLGDQQGLLKTYGNLGLIHGEAKDFARAIDCAQQVLAIAARTPVEPETVAATHLNLGAAYFWQNRWDAAIRHYQQGLQIAQAARLVVLVGRAHYNLAEAHYKRFQALDQADDELQGDAHAAAALAAWPQAEAGSSGGGGIGSGAADSAAAQATRQLKRDILGPGDAASADRLLPGELAAHFPELLAVQRHRAALALPLPPDQQVAAHLAIAQAYLQVAVQEREAALALARQHGLTESLTPQLRMLGDTFGQAHSRHQALSALWRQQAGDLLAAEACEALLQHLLTEGALSKRHCAPLCGVGLATASKHLGLLTARGLLVQTGKGPATRYHLPDEAA